ncbi:unnamed protein product [Pylaiella littoralis]
MPPQRQQHLTAVVVVAVPLCAAVFAALLGYRAGAVAWRRKRNDDEAREERDAHQRGPAAGMQHHLPLRQLIHGATGRGFGAVKRIYVVPGGGPGSSKDAGYPPWTAQRVAKALQRYDAKYGDTTAFIALGAGSMNAASARRGNGHVVFESAKIVEELVRGGVPPGSIIADFASWDTVGNAWFARMAVEAILDMSFRQGDRASEPHAAPPPPPLPPRPPQPSGHTSPSLLTPRKLPYPGSAIAEGGGGGGGGMTGRAGFCAPVGGDETGAAGEREGEGAGEGAGRPRRTATQKELKRADAAAAAAAAAAARTGAGRGGGAAEEGEEKLPAARAGEAYGGGEMRKWMYEWKAKKARARRGPLNVTVFVSDFHAERMDAVFQWVFGLEPSLLKGNRVTVTTVSIDTPVEMWARGEEQSQARRAHEREGADQARQRAKEIRTVEEFRAFMMLGGHHGYFNLTHGGFQASAGGGWGGAS